MKLIKNPYFNRRGRGRRINNLRLLLMPKLRKYVFFLFKEVKFFILSFEYHKQVQMRYTFKLSLGHKIHLKESVTKRFQAESRVKVTYQDHSLKKYFILFARRTVNLFLFSFWKRPLKKVKFPQPF